VVKLKTGEGLGGGARAKDRKRLRGGMCGIELARPAVLTQIQLSKSIGLVEQYK